MKISENNTAIMEVRRRTLAPIWGCKKALEGCGWDVDQACMSIAKALHESKNGKSHDSYGEIALYSHEFGRVGSMVELTCESGYVAKSRDFIKLANIIAIHIAWSNPIYVDRSQIDPREIATARATCRLREAAVAGSAFLDMNTIDVGISPENPLVERGINERMEKTFYPMVCLLDQLEMKDTQGTKTIGTLVSEMANKTGEKITVRRFSRFKIGE